MWFGVCIQEEMCSADEDSVGIPQFQGCLSDPDLGKCGSFDLETYI